jgi:hypothetical protein
MEENNSQKSIMYEFGKNKIEVNQEIDGKIKLGRMEEAPENGKESSHCAHGNGMK